MSINSNGLGFFSVTFQRSRRKKFHVCVPLLFNSSIVCIHKASRKRNWKKKKKVKKLSNEKPQPFFCIRKWQSRARGGALNKHHEKRIYLSIPLNDGIRFPRKFNFISVANFISAAWITWSESNAALILIFSAWIRQSKLSRTFDCFRLDARGVTNNNSTSSESNMTESVCDCDSWL
jgi:hypothetical protein